MSNFSEDWISILVIIIAGVIGVIKPMLQKKKVQPANRPQTGGYHPEAYEEEIEEETQEYKEPEITPAFSSDFYRDPKEEIRNNQEISTSIESTAFSSLQEDGAEEEIESVQFDIRQAVISSEILQRRSF